MHTKKAFNPVVPKLVWDPQAHHNLIFGWLQNWQVDSLQGKRIEPYGH